MKLMDKLKSRMLRMTKLPTLFAVKAKSVK